MSLIIPSGRPAQADRSHNVQFCFADHTLDTERRELYRGSEPIAVEPQVFDLLIYLMENRDRVVSKDDLIASVWGGRIVSDSTLTSRINAARKAVGDSGEEQKLIRTIARKGLRFVGEVRTQPTGTEPADARPRTKKERNGSRRAKEERPFLVVFSGCFESLSGQFCKSFTFFRVQVDTSISSREQPRSVVFFAK
jgi:DNA-binding winged helix-turn-helix (wHTH) protein